MSCCWSSERLVVVYIHPLTWSIPRWYICVSVSLRSHDSKSDWMAGVFSEILLKEFVLMSAGPGAAAVLLDAALDVFRFSHIHFAIRILQGIHTAR